MMSERWAELKIGSEGLSISLYEEENGHVSVIDEAWWTWSEIEALRGPDSTTVVLDDGDSDD